jgi:hypothetical protein
MGKYYELTIGSERKEAIEDLLAIISLHATLNKLLDTDEGIQEKCDHDNVAVSGSSTCAECRPVAPVYSNKYETIYSQLVATKY